MELPRSMELTNFHHRGHHHYHPKQNLRYVSDPNSSLPYYADNANFYNSSDHHRHHRIRGHQAQRQSRPLPPPRGIQTRFQPLPSGQSSSLNYHPPQMHPYDPEQLRFTFADSYQDRPSLEDNFFGSLYHFRDLVFSPQLPFQIHHHRHNLLEFEQVVKQEFWVQQRVLTKNMPVRSRSHLEFGRGSLMFEFDQKLMLPFVMDGKLRNASVCISGFKLKHRVKLLGGEGDDSCSCRASFLSSPGTFFRGMESDVDSLHLDKSTSLDDKIRNCEESMLISRSCTHDNMQPSTDGALTSLPITRLFLEKSIIPIVKSLCSEGLRHEQKNVDAEVTAAIDKQSEVFNLENTGEEMLGVSAPKEVNAQEVIPRYLIPSEASALDIDQRLSLTGIEFDKDEFPSLSHFLHLPIYKSGVSTVTSCDEAVEFVHISDATPGSQISNEFCREDGNVKMIVDTDVSSTDEISLLQYTDVDIKSDSATGNDKLIEKKSISPPLHDSRSFPEGVNINGADYYNGKKNQLGHSTPRTVSGRMSFAFTNVKSKGTSYHVNPRTWHRNNGCSASPPGDNFFLRPSQAAAFPQGSSGFCPANRLNTPGLDESKSCTNRVGTGMSNHSLRKGEMMPSFENYRPSWVHSSTRNNDVSKFVKDLLTSENLNGPLTCLDNQSELDGGNLAHVNKKRIMPETPKSNQYVAISKSTDFSIPSADKIQASSFNGYLKRRKNQLIRTSLKSQTKQPLVTPDNNLNMGIQITFKAISSSTLCKRHSQNVVGKTFKRSSNSLVWTLCNSLSSKNDCDTINHQKVYPQLFPWKGPAYSKNLMQNWNSISKSNSFATSGSLLLSRNRDTVYTRSINGFSLRKSKLISVDGSSLKWSKPIDLHSEEANELVISTKINFKNLSLLTENCAMHMRGFHGPIGHGLHRNPTGFVKKKVRMCERTRHFGYEITITIDAVDWIIKTVKEVQQKEDRQR
ncbi:hypothetical protein G4B88_011069, partial [Cannabis sativa]